MELRKLKIHRNTSVLANFRFLSKFRKKLFEFAQFSALIYLNAIFLTFILLCRICYSLI